MSAIDSLPEEIRKRDEVLITCTCELLRLQVSRLAGGRSTFANSSTTDYPLARKNYEAIERVG